MWPNEMLLKNNLIWKWAKNTLSIAVISKRINQGNVQIIDYSTNKTLVSFNHEMGEPCVRKDQTFIAENQTFITKHHLE